MKKYNTITRSIIKEIALGKYDINEKLPSERALSIKYSCSRIVATRAYQELEKIGAIYSKPKIGYFVAEHFSGLGKSLGFEFDATEYVFVGNDIFLLPEEKDIIEKQKFSCFSMKIKNKSSTKIILDVYLPEYLKENIKTNNSVFDQIWEAYNITSIVTKYHFEKFEYFDQDFNLTGIRTIFAIDGKNQPFQVVLKFCVHPDNFHLTKQEFIV